MGAPEWSSKLLLVPTGPAEETKDATGGRRVGDGGRGGGASRDGVTSRCQQGHRGFLFELFELQQEGSNAEKYFQGLASLLCECEGGARGGERWGYPGGHPMCCFVGDMVVLEILSLARRW